MANWEQILTDGTSISKLADVNITAVGDGDLLIGTAADGGSWSDAALTNLVDNQIKVVFSAGGIDLGLETDVDVAGVLTSGSFTAGGGFGDTGTSISAAGVIQTDGSVTVGGDLVSDADEAKNIFAAVTTAGNKITIGGGGQVDIVGDLSLKTDSKQIKFGANDEITLSHSHDAGLILKHDASGDDKYPTLTLQTGDTDIADCDKLGVINFQAPDEGTGTDAIVVAASIHAESEGDFSASNNASAMSFSLATSGAVTERMRLSSIGHLSVDADLITTGGNIRSGNMGSSTSAIIVGSYAQAFDGTAGSDAKVYGDLIVGGGDIIFPQMVGKVTSSTTGAGVAGKDLTIEAGSAPAGDTNLAGGKLYLKSGGGDGTGTSTMEFHTKVSGSDTTSKAMEINGSGDVVISNNLTVSGTTVTLDTQTIELEDNVIVLNSNSSGAAASGSDAGIRVQRGANLNHLDAALFWDESYAAVDDGVTDLDGRWAVGSAAETGTAPSTTFAAPAVGTYGGYLVAITESTGTPASGDLATGLGAMHIKTGSGGQIYIRVS